MPSTNNPYAALPPEKYWKTGVAERGTARFPRIWEPRFAIDRSTKFATAGSCFAQHISKWLQNNDYQWLDSEPAPADCTPEEKANAAYGVFTFRTGNIYTAALLKQWVFWALGLAPVTDEVVYEDGRYYDPFRPLIPGTGYAGADELRQERTQTLNSIRQTLLETDIFIFTLGLTEGWQNVAGHVYPMCPGTARGEFSPAEHHFVNQRFESIMADLNETFDAIRALNPRIKFLLTVSPVPLTATASDAHVLVATSYSKSVLRAVAGSLQATRDDVDYFSSYELISSFPIRGQFYEDNLRSVKKQGVEYVMSHFGESISGVSVAAPEVAVPKVKATEASKEDVLCEDILLQTWNQHGQDTESVQVCLIGDSHMGMLSKSLGELGVKHCGGMIMNGSAWFANKFHPDADELFVPLEDKSARARWAQTVPFFGAEGRVPQNSQIILNIGMQTHMSVPSLVDWFFKKNGHLQLNALDIVEFFKSVNAGKLAIISNLLAQGYRVLALTDPPTQSISTKHGNILPAFNAYDLIATTVLRSMGCQVLNVREHFVGEKFSDKYYSQQIDEAGERDWLHGSDAYYKQIAEIIQGTHLEPTLP